MGYLKELYKTAFNLLAILTLTMAIIYPFCYGMKDFPNWTGFIIYPLSIMFMAHTNLKIKEENEKA